MNCDGVRGLLSAYLDGELSPGELLRVEQHLRRCHCCADEVDSLRRTMVLVASLEEVEVPAAFRSRLHERLVALGPPVGSRRVPAAPVWQRHLRTWALPAAAAAAVLAVGVSNLIGVGDLEGLMKSSTVSIGGEPVARQTNPQPVTETKTPLQVADTGRKTSPDTAVKPVTEPAKPSEPQPSGEIPAPGPEASPPATVVAVQPVPTELSAYTASYLRGVSPVETKAQYGFWTYSLNAAVSDPGALASELRSRYPASTTVSPNTVVITISASAAKTELDYIRTRLGKNVEEKEPFETDLSANLKLSYDRLATLDHNRDLQIKQVAGVRDPAMLEVARKELQQMSQAASEERNNLEGLNKQLDKAIIIVTLTKQPVQ